MNPFVSQLIPLSFSQDLVLNLILCQSATHRATATGDESQLVLAYKYYNKSICCFQQAIAQYVENEDGDPLWIVLGALLLCLTEVCLTP